MEGEIEIRGVFDRGFVAVEVDSYFNWRLPPHLKTHRPEVQMLLLMKLRVDVFVGEGAILSISQHEFTICLCRFSRTHAAALLVVIVSSHCGT